MVTANDKTSQKAKPSDIQKPRQKHRPSALSLNKTKSKMQDIAVDILSPGINPESLDLDQKNTIELSKSIEQQQKELIASKNGTIKTATVANAPSNSKKRTIATPTIIIEQVSNADTNKANSAVLSPLHSSKKFKRSNAPPPLKISRGSQNIAPTIQTAPIRNASQLNAAQVQQYYNNGQSTASNNNSRVVNHRLATHRRPLAGLVASPFSPRFAAGTPAQQQAALAQTAAIQAVQAAAQAAAVNANMLSPLASAFFAPRYYPVVPTGSVATPAALTPGLYNPYYRSLLLQKSQLNTPRNPSFTPSSAGIMPPGAPGHTNNIQTPTTSINGGMPITPLNYAFQSRPILTSLENYVINRNEASTLSEINKDALKKSVKLAAAAAATKKEPEEAKEKTVPVENIPRKTLQTPLGSNIVKQTISTNKKKANGEPKTPIHLQKSNTPHVTDVFPNEMTKFAPVSNQPLSARDEHFDFNLYKEEPIFPKKLEGDSTEAESSKKRTKDKKKPNSRLNKQESIAEQEDEDDVESKAIEDDSKINDKF